MQANTNSDSYPMNGIEFSYLHDNRIIVCKIYDGKRSTVKAFAEALDEIILQWINKPFLILYDFRNTYLRFSPFFADCLKNLPEIAHGRHAILTQSVADRKQIAFFPYYFPNLECRFFDSYELSLAWLEEWL